ncbi:hypothetical protein FGO68_gene1895 [Halteria grandinella]|uniref:Uncharacterized protein n=1 Tax=Halteria grandinella TaxID=5974 RepID=A0A8J8NWF7_HALGN|nr:hypothetical protein FGO68_gene1895 [Halteria grandinella]
MKSKLFGENTPLPTEQPQQQSTKYARLPNGMIINHDVNELKRQNDMLAKINAYVAGNKDKNGEIHMPFGMIDSKSMAEFYSDLFSYAPCILKDAIHKGDEFERFKLVLKFAISILHNLTFQDVFQKKPLMPILGETYEGHYIYQDIAQVFMESDYVEFDYVDLLTLRDVIVRKEQATTYIQIEGHGYEISGNLTYDSRWKGNNLVIALPGHLRVKFVDLEGQDQEVEIQLPEYVLSGYYYVGKPSMILINGPLVVVDKKNRIKSVVLFNGLTKDSFSLLSSELTPNTKNSMQMVQGLIYKYNHARVEQYIEKGRTFDIKTLKDLYDVEYKLERIQGNAIDYYEIEEVPQSNWKHLQLAEPIPSELALPSDIRFREDLIWMKRGDKGKGKVWKGMMEEQRVKDMGQLGRKSDRGQLRKKPKRVY